MHHEDLRRAQPGWEPRQLTAADEDALWTALRLGGRYLTRAVAVPLQLSRSDTDGTARLRRGDDPVSIFGRPSELALFVFGRSQVSDLSFEGPEESIAALRAADLGV